MQTRKDLDFAPNLENLVKAVNRIIENPSERDQKIWHCGNAHCLLGWGQILYGKPNNVIFVVEDALDFFGLPKNSTVFRPVFRGAEKGYFM